MFASGINFGLGEEIEALRDTVRRFAESRIAPLAAETDRNNAFPMHLWRELGELGVLGITAPEEYGGAGMGYLAHCITMEEISRASASIGLSYGLIPISASTRSSETVLPTSARNICQNLFPASMSARSPCPSRARGPMSFR